MLHKPNSAVGNRPCCCLALFTHIAERQLALFRTRTAAACAAAFMTRTDNIVDSGRGMADPFFSLSLFSARSFCLCCLWAIEEIVEIFVYHTACLLHIVSCFWYFSVTFHDCLCNCIEWLFSIACLHRVFRFLEHLIEFNKYQILGWHL